MGLRFSRTGGYRQRVDKSVRSNFEARIKRNLLDSGVKFEYESKKIKYETKHTYTPDFVFPNGVIVEAKGYFQASDRTKHLAVKKQHPELDIRFLFQRDERLRKGSKTKYSDWCKKHGFKFAIGETVPKEWIEERGSDASVRKTKKTK